MESNKNDWMRQYARFSSTLLQTIIIIILGIFAGKKIDKFFELKKPIFLLIFTIIFSVIAFYLAFKEFMRKK